MDERSLELTGQDAAGEMHDLIVVHREAKSLIYDLQQLRPVLFLAWGTDQGTFLHV